MDTSNFSLIPSLVHAVTATLLAVSVAACSEDLGQAPLEYPIQSFDEYKALLDDLPLLIDPRQARTTKGVMERTMLAHHNMDTDAAIAELDENYAWMRVFQGSAAAAVSGREVAREVTNNVYGGDYLHDYLGSDAQPIAIIGNLGVQLETENFKNEDGSLRTSTSVSIYEIKDGKLWRLWAFTPTEPDPEENNLDK